MIIGILLLLCVISAVISMTTTIIRLNTQQPKTKIVYRYMPRTFEEEQENLPLVSDIFRTMFTDQTPWVNSVMSYDRRKEESINKYYISQI